MIVLGTCCLNFMSALAHFPHFCRLEHFYRNTGHLTKISSKTSECSNFGKLFGVLFLMSRSSFLLKLIGKSCLRQN